jgi:hypothetical protein
MHLHGLFVRSFAKTTETQRGIRTLSYLSGIFTPLVPRSPPHKYECMRNTDVFSISMRPEETAWLAEICQRERRTRSEVIREALRACYPGGPSHLNEVDCDIAGYMVS